MKRLLFVLLLVPFISFSQDTLPKYTEVVTVDSVSKDELYNRAKKWFAVEYKSSKDVVQLDSKDEIIGKGSFAISYYFRSPYITHTVRISIKDGRYKYNISDFQYLDKQGDTFALDNFPKGWTGKKKLFTNVDTEVKRIILSLKKAMSSKDEW